MSPRLFPAIAISLALVVAGCSSAQGAPADPASPAPVVRAPTPTPVPVPPSPTRPDSSPSPVIGGVDGSAGGVELTVEAVDGDTIQVTIADPAAKAWRVTVAGTGERGGDRWDIVVETGDVAPVITATEIRGGEVVDVLDLSGFFDGTAITGGCHSSLPVCLDSDGFVLPQDGDGLFSVRLELPEAQVPLVIRGGTAGWDAEPFVLGPWHETEPFPWGEG